ncbi:MAG: hypothetical protein Q8907_04290 [Bacteroidota bacterium]|nr:hypothetical protein [Bacteroidota bacterium]MDP4273478.1 hypothetical protein [Bacteroidota bacterium]
MEKNKVEFEQVIEKGWGLDVHRDLAIKFQICYGLSMINKYNKIIFVKLS